MSSQKWKPKTVYHYIRRMVGEAYLLYEAENDPSYGDDQLNEASLELSWFEHHKCISAYNAERIADLFGIYYKGKGSVTT